MASVPENTALDFIVQNLTSQQLDYIEACPYTDGPQSLIECIEEAVLEYHEDRSILPEAKKRQEMISNSMIIRETQTGIGVKRERLLASGEWEDITEYDKF